MYGKNQEFEVVYNSIDTKKFLFNENIRNKIRKELNVENNLILGNIGRLEESKNQKFLIKIFEKVLAFNLNAQLWIIGDGNLKKELKELVLKKGLQDNVKFFGTKENVNEYLMAMDIFVFPSIYEGLGIALIEAQFTGIDCIVSENIVNEAIITKNVIKLALDDENNWVKEILNIKKHNRSIDAISNEINNYKIKNLISKMEKIYAT